MKDIENLVYTNIVTALSAASVNAETSSVYIDDPASFPYVYFAEITRRVDTAYMSTSGIDEAFNLTFECAVYSDKTPGAKQECKEIMRIVDEAMSNMRFRLSYHATVPNLDRNITRLIHRYTGTVRIAYNGTDTEFYVIPK